MNKSFCLKFILFCLVAIGAAQVTLSQESLTNFGVSVNGVTLSIELTNRVIAVESTIRLSAHIVNSSTNVIIVGESYAPEDFAVFLASDSGRILKRLTPKASREFYRYYDMSIAAGRVVDWNIPVIIGKDIEPGDYTLVATRRFSIGNAGFDLVSNLLKVQITK